MYGQEPDAGGAAANAGADFLQQLELLGWVDRTALAVLLVFFVIGLFKGLFWQISRIAVLLIAYVVAGQFGGDLGRWVVGDSAEPADSTLYLAYLVLFLVVVVVLGIVAMQLQKLVKKTGLGFFDRIGGGLFGIATGACTVLFLLFVVNMFFKDTALWQDADASHSQRLSRQALGWLGPRVPEEVRGVLDAAPLGPAPTPGGAEPDPKDH